MLRYEVLAASLLRRILTGKAAGLQDRRQTLVFSRIGVALAEIVHCVRVLPVLVPTNVALPYIASILDAERKTGAAVAHINDMLGLVLIDAIALAMFLEDDLVDDAG